MPPCPPRDDGPWRIKVPVARSKGAGEVSANSEDLARNKRAKNQADSRVGCQLYGEWAACPTLFFMRVHVWKLVPAPLADVATLLLFGPLVLPLKRLTRVALNMSLNLALRFLATEKFAQS
jgi:hypothetical protein